MFPSCWHGYSSVGEPTALYLQWSLTKDTKIMCMWHISEWPECLNSRVTWRDASLITPIFNLCNNVIRWFSTWHYAVTYMAIIFFMHYAPFIQSRNGLTEALFQRWKNDTGHNPNKDFKADEGKEFILETEQFIYIATVIHDIVFSWHEGTSILHVWITIIVHN